MLCLSELNEDFEIRAHLLHSNEKIYNDCESEVSELEDLEAKARAEEEARREQELLEQRQGGEEERQRKLELKRIQEAEEERIRLE